MDTRGVDKRGWRSRSSLHVEMAEYVASADGFFTTLCCIDCSPEMCCAFTDADREPREDRVHGKKTVNVGEDVVVSG